MKRFLIVAVLAILASCAPKNKEFKLTVTFTGDPEECSAFLTSDTLILKNYTKDKENECIYKSVIADNKAVFSGIVKTPEQYALLLGPDARRPFASLFLENAQITMNVKVNGSDDPSGERFTIEISGAPVQATLDSLDAAVPGNLRALVKEYYSTSDQDAKDSIIAIYEQLVSVKEEMRAEYVNAHPYSQIALMELLSNIEEISADSAKAKLEAFQALPEYSENHNIISALGTVKRLKALEPGAKAPDFTQNDPEGNPVNLYEFIKDYKVTMIDFWASWCSPCRHFNPTLIKIYEKYHKLGLGIIGVSLDAEKEAWVEAIKADKLTWSHVSDLQYWNNEVASLYMVKYIPQNIFVTSDGTIIKRQVKEDEIEALLDEYLK